MERRVREQDLGERGTADGAEEEDAWRGEDRDDAAACVDRCGVVRCGVVWCGVAW